MRRLDCLGVRPYRGAPPAECNPPTAKTAPHRSVAQWQHVAGTYTLTVIATQGSTDDTIARGTLSLWRPDSSHAEARPNAMLPNYVVHFPPVGAADVNLLELGPLALGIPTESRDPDRPGVVMHEDGRLDMGGGNGPRVVVLDAGVMFRLLEVNDEILRGTWVSGGLALAKGELPAGYFCAVRTI